MKRFLFTGIFLLIISSCSFQQENKSDTKTISFMTWNTQTFFDSITDGCEYKEFQSAKNWNEQKYKTRLSRLCEVLQTINADIIVLEEIENEAVLQDISNMVAGNSWNKNIIWQYACFSKEENDAIGCGILSRFPISDIKTHSLIIKSEKTEQPPMRPIIQISIDVNGKELVVFINHWKSKSGGAAETEKWRKWQGGVLSTCINQIEKEGKKYCVAAGDFNQDISEFSKSEKTSEYNILLPLSPFRSGTIGVYSPWYDNSYNFTTDIGSYYYNGKWERIDDIFVRGKIKISDFSPVAEEPWTDINKIPIKYKYYTDKGYSDHLPLFCNLIF